MVEKPHGADLFDPSDKQLQNLFQGEDVFPLSPFNERQYLIPLRECSLQTEVSAQKLFQTLDSISLKKSSIPLKVSERIFSRIVAVIDYISSHLNLLSESVNVENFHLHLDKAIRWFSKVIYQY